jgi:uncharacterized membrane protein/protein-disulfide isomerase
MTPRSRLIILSLALIGLAFAASSTWVHYKLVTDASYTSPCDMTATFNCSQAYLSQYGSLAGVPVAIAGAAWFALVAAIAFFARPDKTSAAGTYIYVLSTIALAFVLYLGYASFAVLKTACILCLGTYASVIGIFIAAGSTTKIPMGQLPSRIGRDLSDALKNPAALVAILAILATTGTLAVAFPPEGTRPAAEQPTMEQATSFEAAWAQQPRIDLGIKAEGARVIIVKFNDYQCPGCKQAHEFYKPVLEKFAQSHPGAVKQVVKDWPWDNQCNFNAPTATGHPGACAAAAAVRIAQDHGADKVTEMEDWIWANQLTLTRASVKSAAERILGITDYDRQYELKKPDIQRDIADGGALSIRSTPTLFINGVRVEQILPPAFFEQAIQIELNKPAGK